MKHISIGSIAVVLCCVLLVTGCSTSQSSVDGNDSYVEQLKRKLTPRPFRDQIFSNNPTAYNQERFYEEDPEDVMRQLRNGTRGIKQDYRMTARNHRSTERYRAQEGAPEKDSYGEGFEDGCQNFMAAVGNGFYRVNKPVFHTERMSEDAWYLRGYQDGAMFCTHRTDWEIH